jgi:hypothetical protein
MYKIKRSDVKILIYMRKRSTGCSWKDAEQQVNAECGIAEDIRYKNQEEHEKEYMKEYNRVRRAKLKKAKIISSLIPA